MTEWGDIQTEQWQKHLEEAQLREQRREQLERQRPWKIAFAFCLCVVTLFLLNNARITVAFSQHYSHHLDIDARKLGDWYGFRVQKDVIGGEATLQIWHGGRIFQQYRAESSWLKKVEHFEWLGEDTAFYLHLTLEKPGGSVNIEETARLIYDFDTNQFLSPNTDYIVWRPHRWESHDVRPYIMEDEGVIPESQFKAVLARYRKAK